MSNIILRPLAINDLSISYARPMGGNKIKHYRAIRRFDDKEELTSTKALELIKAYILKEEGKEESELQFTIEVAADLMPPQVSEGNAMQVQEVDILKNDRDILKALNKRKVKSLIVSTDIRSIRSLRVRVQDYLANNLNPIICKINELLRRLQGLSVNEILFYNKGISLPVLPFSYSSGADTRRVDLVHYLSVYFEGPEYEKAKLELVENLRILKDNDLILGSLSLPSLIPMADGVGSGHQQLALFCFPVIDQKKLKSLIGEEAYNGKKPTLQWIGCNLSVHEGGVGSLTNKTTYEIEYVTVNPIDYEAMRMATLEAFQESIPSVNKAADATRKLIRENKEVIDRAQRELALAIEAGTIKELNKPKKLKKKTKKKIVKKKAKNGNIKKR